MHNRWWAAPGLAAAVVMLAACGTSASPTDPAPSSTVPAANAAAQADAGTATVAIKKLSTSKGTVLTTAGGMTLYWFGKDTATRSNCNGSCATYWPPVIGTPVAAAGTSLPHGFGTIKRADGQTQATYDGHPLYTYTGDTGAGQVSGNGLNLSGGLWWAVTPSGKALGKASPSSGGGGSSSSAGTGGGW